MRIAKLAILISVALLAGCTTATSNPAATLDALARESKFAASGCYPGTDLPEDREPLTNSVDQAIRDITLLPRPRDPELVRSVLKRLINEVDQFATRDRERAYDYAIRIWQASGVGGESRLFLRTDQETLRLTATC